MVRKSGEEEGPTSFHFQLRTPFGADGSSRRSFLPAASRGTTGRTARGSGNTIPRPRERRHFHNIQMYKSAGPKLLKNEKGRGSVHRRREIRRYEKDRVADEEKAKERKGEAEEEKDRREGRKKGGRE